MSQLPDAIHIAVTARTEPLPGLLVLTRIIMREKNDYWGIFGATDAQGLLTITRAELLQGAQLTRDFLPDEFADPEIDADGVIEVRVLDEAGIDRALDAAAASSGYPYPGGYLQMLQAARVRLVALGRVLMEVSVMTEGGTTEVKAQPPL